MPAASRWMIRASLMYLLAGVIIGAGMLIAKAHPAFTPAWLLLSVHIEITIFGWIIQLTMGTAYWILPRFLKGEPRGNRWGSLLMVALLNMGILLNVATYLNWMDASTTVVGRSLEVLAIIFFVGLHWNRVVTYR